MKINELDNLIQQLLEEPSIKEDIEATEKRAKEEHWGKQEGDNFVPWSLQQSKIQVIYNYLIDGDLVTVLSNPLIFAEIQSYIVENTKRIIYQPEIFLQERHKINGEKMTDEILIKLYNEIENRIYGKI